MKYSHKQIWYLGVTKIIDRYIVVYINYLYVYKSVDRCQAKEGGKKRMPVFCDFIKRNGMDTLISPSALVEVFMKLVSLVCKFIVISNYFN